jgi:hypothetical protein
LSEFEQEKRHSRDIVKAALQRMGFHPKDEVHAFFTLVRFDADSGPCVLILDGYRFDISESELARSLGAAGVDLAEFWNSFDIVQREQSS